MKIKLILLLAVFSLLSACCHSDKEQYGKPQPTWQADKELEPEIKGNTYSKGIQHPTFWETIFEELHIGDKAPKVTLPEP